MWSYRFHGFRDSHFDTRYFKGDIPVSIYRQFTDIHNTTLRRESPSAMRDLLRKYASVFADVESGLLRLVASGYAF